MGRKIKFRIGSKIYKKVFYEGFSMTPEGLQSICYANCDLANFELSQYTGLKDCEHNDIYEGDILEYKRNNNIFWRTEKFVVYDAFESYIYLKRLLLGYSAKDMKIIGNIYENPELLKGERQ